MSCSARELNHNFLAFDLIGGNPTKQTVQLAGRMRTAPPRRLKAPESARPGYRPHEPPPPGRRRDPRRPASPHPTPAQRIRPLQAGRAGPARSQALIVLMQARRRRRDRVVLKEPRGAAGVLRCDHRNFAQDPEGAQGHILQVADRSGDNIEGAWHCGRADCTKCIQPNPFRTSSTSISRTSTKSHPTNRRIRRRPPARRPRSRTWAVRQSTAQIRALGGFARRLAAIDPARLTDTERLERPALESNIRSRLFELEQVRTWERSLQHYAEILATSLAGQVLFDYAPLAERARRVHSKLRQVPRLMQSARDNIKDPPGIYLKVGLESLRGTLRFINDDLPRAFGDLGDLHLLGDLADAATEAATAIGGLHRVPGKGAGAAEQGLVSTGPGEIRAEVPARRRASRLVSIGC